MAELDFKIIETSGGDRRRSVPLPLLYGPFRYGVRRQNQVLAPQRVAPSTPVKRVIRFRRFGADDKHFRVSRAREQYGNAG